MGCRSSRTSIAAGRSQPRTVTFYDGKLHDHGARTRSRYSEPVPRGNHPTSRSRLDLAPGAARVAVSALLEWHGNPRVGPGATAFLAPKERGEWTAR